MNDKEAGQLMAQIAAGFAERDDTTVEECSKLAKVFNALVDDRPDLDRKEWEKHFGEYLMNDMLERLSGALEEVRDAG